MKVKKSISYILIFIFSILCYSNLIAQLLEVRNVRFEDKGNTIIVYYDLHGKYSKNYRISLSLSDDIGKTFKIKPLEIMGDVGKDIKPGMNKSIIWKVKQEYPNGLIGDGFVFAVDAELQKGGKKWPYFVIGATATVTGIFFYMSNTAEREKTTTGSIVINIPRDF